MSETLEPTEPEAFPCGDRGPRVGESRVVCGLPAGHAGQHLAPEWNGWGNERW